MLNLIVADAEIEQVPKEIANHRVIRWYAKRRGRLPTEIILNSGLHYEAMRGFKDGDRRGRPDIAHMCVLLALDTPLNREGLLRTYIHTRHDKLITVDPSVRLPRMSNRFEGLLEQLFLAGEALPEKPLLRLENASLKELVERMRSRRVITFSDGGKRRSIGEAYAGLSKEDDVCLIVGGFPRGDFLSEVGGISDEVVSIDPELLTAPTVVARAIYVYEETLGITRSRLGR
ncbi:MAG: 16S rRNA methyltransferase [Methanobacteriota archaeon]